MTVFVTVCTVVLFARWYHFAKLAIEQAIRVTSVERDVTEGKNGSVCVFQLNCYSCLNPQTKTYSSSCL